MPARYALQGPAFLHVVPGVESGDSSGSGRAELGRIGANGGAPAATMTAFLHERAYGPSLRSTLEVKPPKPRVRAELSIDCDSA